MKLWMKKLLRESLAIWNDVRRIAWSIAHRDWNEKKSWTILPVEEKLEEVVRKSKPDSTTVLLLDFISRSKKPTNVFDKYLDTHLDRKD